MTAASSQGQLFGPSGEVLTPLATEKARYVLRAPYRVTLDLAEEYRQSLSMDLPSMTGGKGSATRRHDPISSDDAVESLARATVLKEEVLMASVELCVPAWCRYEGDDFLEHMNWTTDDALADYLDSNFPGHHPRNVVARVRCTLEGWASGGLRAGVPYFLARHPRGGIMPGLGSRDILAHRPTALGVRYYREMLVEGPFTLPLEAD